MKKSKLKYIILTLIILVSSVLAKEVYTFSSYGFPDHTGAPTPGGVNQATCSKSGCHVGKALNDASGNTVFTSNIPADGWQPGITYDITTKISKADVTAFGFMTMAWGNKDSLSTGMLAAASDSKAQVIYSWSGSANTYATHKATSLSGQNSNEWSFKWTAPTTGTNDTVTFFNTFVATNSNGKPAGDYVFTKVHKIGKSSLVTARFDGLDVHSQLILSPTLVDDILTISSNMQVSGNIHLSVRDLNAKEVLRTTEHSNMLSSGLKIDFSFLKSGVYILNIENNGMLVSKKFIKQ